MKGIIPIENFNMGGIADSKYQGLPNTLATMVGIDPHTVPGVLGVNQKMTKDSGSGGIDVIGFCRAAVAASDGNTYWFSSESGNVWARSAGGTWTYIYNTAPTSGSAQCTGAIEYQGYIYWMTQSWIHRIAVRDLASFGTYAEPNWQAIAEDQTYLGGQGATYAVPVAISEVATARQTITPVNTAIEGISVHIDTKGTGNWTLSVHDSVNTLLTSKTIANASLTSGAENTFYFATEWNPDNDTTYHIHLTSTVADGLVSSLTASDLEEGETRLYTVGDEAYHPMHVLNNVLYMGDRELIHQVEVNVNTGVHVFSRAALDIPQPYRVTALETHGTDLIIGTTIDASISPVKVYKWNTWSVSYTIEDTVPEPIIAAWIRDDNNLFAAGGFQGRMYHFNGSFLELIKTIPGEYSDSTRMRVYPESKATYKGRAIFGVSNESGATSVLGIWSFGRRDSNYPRILTMDYPISPRSSGAIVTSGIRLGAILVVGDDVFVAWENTTAGTHGVDKIDHSNKLDGAYFETRIIAPSRTKISNFIKYLLNYVTIPASTSLSLYYRRDYDTSWTEITLRQDNKHLSMMGKLSIPASPLQLKVVFNTNNDDAPLMESLHVITE